MPVNVAAKIGPYMNDGGLLGSQRASERSLLMSAEEKSVLAACLASTFDTLEWFENLAKRRFVMNCRQHLVLLPAEEHKVKTNSKKLLERKQCAETF